MSRQIPVLFVFATLLGACAEQAPPPQTAEAPAAPETRTIQQGLLPFQDSALWAAPAGTASNSGGPTSTCEVEILRERSFTTTPPVVTNTGITLTPANTARDGQFSQSLFVRSGPFANQTADPDCQGTIIIPAGITVVGASGATDAEVAAAQSVFGIPSVNYTSSTPASEAGEMPVITVNGDGTTTVAWTASVNTTPFTDTFRLLLDHGTAFRAGTVSVSLTHGASINLGGARSGMTALSFPLAASECGDGVVSVGETCDDSNAAPGDGCSAMCAVEVGFTCPTAGGQCLTVALAAPAENARLNASPVAVSGTATAGASVLVELLDIGLTVVGSQTVTATGGNWSASIAASPDGNYTARATVTTTGGAISDTNTFILDTTPPAAPVVIAPANGSLTNDSTPTYAGTAESSSTVTVNVDGSIVGTATADISGDWTLTQPTPLPDGSHTVRVTATDAAGNTSVNSNTNTFTIDTTAPAAPVVITPANGSRTNDSTPTYTGTAEATITVTVLVDGTSVGTATADGAGNWSLTPVGALADGSHTVRATATDLAGNVSPNSNTNTFTVDTTPPAAPVVVAPANGSRTSDSTPAYAGTAEAASTVTVNVDGSIVGTTTADGAGNWTFTQPTALADGSHTVRVTATDAAGNTSVNSNTNTFTIDTTAPAAPVVVTPANGSRTNDSTPTYAGTAEAGSTVTVIVDGASVGTATADGSGNWSLTPAGALADGPHTVRATAADVAGNTSPSSNTNTFTVDTAAPAAPVVTAPANGARINNNTPAYTGTAEASSTVTIFVDGTSVGTTTANGAGAWTFTQPTALADGSHTVRVTATDAAGNVSVNSNTNTFTVDTAAPAAPVVTAPANASRTNDSTPAYTGTAEANSTVTIFVDGSNVGTTTASGAGAWTFTQPTALADGSHTVRVTATDAAGNVSPNSNTNTFTVDTTAPAAPVVVTPANGSRTSDNTPTYSGTAEAGSTVTVNVDGASAGTTTADGSGNWTFTQPTALADGSHAVRVTATDLAGNVSPNSNTNTFTVDTTAPAAPVVTAPANGARTNDSTPAYTGTAEANSTVAIFVDGAQLTTVTASAAGAWTFTQPTVLADGPHTVRATATDAVGNVSASSATNTFTVDTVAPVVTLTAPANNASLNAMDVTVSGTVNDQAATVTASVNGGAAQPVMVGAGGALALPLVGLAEGAYTVVFTATDAAGNSSTATRTFTIDRTAPTVTIVQPAQATRTRDNTPTISGTGEAGSSVAVEVYNAQSQIAYTATVVVNAQGQWTTDATMLADGNYTVLVIATDAAGNTAGAGPRQFTVDATAPAVTITQPANNAVTADTTPTIAGATEQGASVLVEVRNAQNQVVYSATVTAGAQGFTTDATALVSGVYTARAIATDAAGNASQPATVTFTIDTSAPALAITAPANNSATNDTTPTLSGTAAAGASVVLVVRDAQSMSRFNATVTADAGGVWTATSAALAEGAYTLDATTTNQAGTSSSAQVSFTVDLSVALTVATPGPDAQIADSTPTVAGSVEQGASVTIRVVDAVTLMVAFTVTVQPDAFGIWTTTTTTLPDGDYLVQVSATDALGNMATAAEVPITIDTAAPPIAITQPTDGAILGMSPSIEGTSEPGASVLVVVEDSAGMLLLSTQVTADVAGAWSVPTQLTDAGAYTVTAVAQDIAGNSAEASADFTLDLDAASVAIVQPASGATVTTAQPTVSGTSSPDASVLVELLDAQGAVVESATVTPDAQGAWTYTAQMTLADGAYTARATATRPNATTATAQSGFTIDTIAPAQVVIIAPAADALLNSQTVTVSGTAEPGDTITIALDDQDVTTVTADANGAWTATLTSVADGAHTIEASSATSSATVSITVDTMAPMIAVTSPATGSAVPDGRPTFTGTGEPGATVIIEVGGVEVDRVTVGPDGMWSWTPTDALAVGEQTITVTGRDAAGNTSQPIAVVITVEEPAPALTVSITAPTEGATTDAQPIISGAATAGAAISVSIDGQVVGMTVASAEGTWSLPLADVDVTLEAGAHTVSVTATAGEESATAGPVNFTVEGGEPVDPNVDISLSGDGCACATAPATGESPRLAWLALVGLVGLLRRRRLA